VKTTLRGVFLEGSEKYPKGRLSLGGSEMVCHRPWGSVLAGAHVSCATGQESVSVSVYESAITPG
jgi:hypothetical protein